MNDIFAIYAFPNMYDIFPYKYNQSELEDLHHQNNLFFSYTVFPLIKHRWKKIFICYQLQTYALSIEIKQHIPYRKVSLHSLLDYKPVTIDYGLEIYKNYNGVSMTFECYSYIKCTGYTNISEITLDVKRGLVVGGNKLSIFSSPYKNKSTSSIGRLGNKNPFLPITFKSLNLITQVDIFKLLSDRKPIIITGSTGIGKTSQLPKLIMWYNYLFGGWQKLDKIQFSYTAKPIVLSLPRVTLVKNNGSNLLHSLGFTDFDESPVELRYGGKTVYTKRQLDGIVLSTNKLTSYSLFNYNIIIIDEIHEHDKIADIMIAILRKNLDKIHTVILMSATLEEDKARLSEFLPEAEFYHISGPILYSIHEIYIKNKIDVLSRRYLDEEKRNISNTLKWCKPKPNKCGIIFLPTVSECTRYLEYLSKKHPDIDFILIHGRLKNISDILQTVQDTNRTRSCILISTPYLESSITITTATHIYDTGRVYIPEPFGGKQMFISKSMMIQRKGRVGRVASGTYIYFYNTSMLKPIKTIDHEFLYEYIIYANHFNLKIPEDLLVIPSSTKILDDSYMYIKSFNIPFDKLFKIYLTYFVSMVEYVKIYNLGGKKAEQLNAFERDDILTEETLDDIKKLSLLVKLKNTIRCKDNYVYTGEILFGPYINKIIRVSSKYLHKNYIYMLTDKKFTLY